VSVTFLLRAIAECLQGVCPSVCPFGSLCSPIETVQARITKFLQ